MNTTKTTEAASHTPGPWRVSNPVATPYGNCWYAICDRQSLETPYDSPAEAQAAADYRMRLEAAAVDLLENLECAIIYSGHSVSGPTHPDVCEDEGEPRWVGFARAAIAKARGQ